VRSLERPTASTHRDVKYWDSLSGHFSRGNRQLVVLVNDNVRIPAIEECRRRFHRMNRYIAIILCFSLVVLLGCSDEQAFDTEAARKNQALGWTAYKEGDFSAALLSFERAVNLDASLADAHNGLGWSHLSASRTSSVNPQIVAKAQDAFEEAIRLDVSNADAWIGLANTLFLRRENASDFQTALLAINNALKANHTFLFRHDYQSIADLHALKAACYYYLGEKALAITSVETSIQVEPQNVAALSLRRLLEF
jgi:tetratricopeptide (TPR) repeat protein